MTDDEREIRTLVDTWMAASKAGDLPAVLSLMADDVIFMVPGREPFGKEAFARDSQAMKGVHIDGRAGIQEIRVGDGCSSAMPTCSLLTRGEPAHPVAVVSLRARP